MKKDEDTLNKEKCKGCTTCCEYISVPLKTPKTEKDFDTILWYILHENVYVWIEEPNNWHVRFETKCKPLKKNICTGGMLVTNSEEIIDRARLSSNHAIVRDEGALEYILYGRGSDQQLFLNLELFLDYMKEQYLSCNL